jgi:hypothetical protein
VPGQPEQAAARRDQPAAHVGQAEPGVLGGDDQVTGQGDLEAARDRGAFHGGDERLGRRALDEAGEAPARQRRPLAGQERLEIHAGADGPAGPGQHGD